MKYFLLVCLCVSVVFAAERPKIALVLSGGGARGAAHVGVLKVLEQNKIPIDMIIGTSMGSFMGGLYAEGKSPESIEKMLVSTDWQEYIRADFDRQQVPMQRKATDYTYQGKLGFGINANHEIVLPTGILKREPLLLKFDELTENIADVKDFDKFPIPFRAVATDIKNGERVVLKSGSLAKAIYASSAIPGGLQPIKINGEELIDGGVSDNIPIQVAKDMGADIIIVVDVSEDFKNTIDVNSYFVVMGQLVDILMRKNANKSLKLLSSKDILITPDLEGYSGLDVEAYPEIIQAGYQAAQKQVKALQKYSLSKDEYEKYRQKHRKSHLLEPFIIDKIEIENHTYLANEIIRKQIHQKVGKPFDATMLRKDILHLYNTMVFDSVNYKIIQKNGNHILRISTTPSWNNRGDVLFSLGLGDDFQGHSFYSLKAGYLMYGVNSLGAEWRTDVEVGKRQHYATQFYQPLDYQQLFYMRPFLSYDKITYSVPTSALGNQELQSRSYGGGLAFGANVTRSFRAEMSFNANRDRSIVDLLLYNQSFNARSIALKFLYDDLDNYNFPRDGLLAELKVKKDAKAWGSDYDYEQISAFVQKPVSYDNNTLIFNAKFAKTNILTPIDGSVTVYDKFFLGGMFNLSGYKQYTVELAGNNVAFANLMYRYRLKNGGFFGSFGMPFYAGATAEIGNVWNDGESFQSSNNKYSTSVYAAADTPLGAFYLTYGYADGHHNSLYLYLGEKF